MCKHDRVSFLPTQHLHKIRYLRGPLSQRRGARAGRCRCPALEGYARHRGQGTGDGAQSTGHTRHGAHRGAAVGRPAEDAPPRGRAHGRGLRTMAAVAVVAVGRAGRAAEEKAAA